MTTIYLNTVSVPDSNAQATYELDDRRFWAFVNKGIFYYSLVIRHIQQYNGREALLINSRLQIN